MTWFDFIHGRFIDYRKMRRAPYLQPVEHNCYGEIVANPRGSLVDTPLHDSEEGEVETLIETGIETEDDNPS